MNYAHVGCARYVIDGTYRATGLFDAGYLGLGRHSQPRQVKRGATGSLLLPASALVEEEARLRRGGGADTAVRALRPLASKGAVVPFTALV